MRPNAELVVQEFLLISHGTSHDDVIDEDQMLKIFQLLEYQIKTLCVIVQIMFCFHIWISTPRKLAHNFLLL